MQNAIAAPKRLLTQDSLDTHIHTSRLRMYSRSKLSPTDNLELSPCALPMRRTSKRMDFSSAESSSSTGKRSFDSGVGSFNLSDEEEEENTSNPIDNFDQMNDDNIGHVVDTKVSRLELKSRLHARRTDRKRKALRMSPSPTACWSNIRSMKSLSSTGITSMQSLNVSPSPTSIRNIKSLMSPSPTGIRSMQSLMSPSPTGIRSMQSLMSPSPDAGRKNTNCINSTMSLSPIAFKTDIRSTSTIMSPSPISLRTGTKRSKLIMSPSPIAVRKNRRSITRPIVSTSPAAPRFNLDESFSDILSSGNQSAKQPRKRDWNCQRSPQVRQLYLDSTPVQPSIGVKDPVKSDVTASNDVILASDVSDDVIQSEKIVRETPLYDACSSNNDVSSTELTGDFRRELCLPCCSTKLSDLNAISPATAMKVINGDYNHLIDDFLIIDCRYPYEYEGGHIKDARNFPQTSDCDEMFHQATLCQFSQQVNTGKRTVILLHCEFSQMRGPTMARHLRNADRAANGSNYPALHYPEIYVIEGGYKAFHTDHPTQCIPQEYIPMDDPTYSAELACFRSKSTKNKKPSHRRVTRDSSAIFSTERNLF